MPDSPYWKLQVRPGRASRRRRRSRSIECCLKLFERLECRDYCRFDWRLDAKGEPKLLEVNPNPGWCWDGHLAKMARLAGISYSEMLEAILKAAEDRLAVQSAIAAAKVTNGTKAAGTPIVSVEYERQRQRLCRQGPGRTAVNTFVVTPQGVASEV